MHDVPVVSPPKLCPACHRGRLEARVIDDEFDFRGDDGPVHVLARGIPITRCPVCGEQYSGPDAAPIRHHAICKALGLLQPEEILAIRNRFGMTQAQFSGLTGFGEATISRWERGRLLQNRANDRYLRLLAGLPGSVPFLEGIVAATTPSAQGV